MLSEVSYADIALQMPPHAVGFFQKGFWPPEAWIDGEYRSVESLVPLASHALSTLAPLCAAAAGLKSRVSRVGGRPVPAVLPVFPLLCLRLNKSFRVSML
jgi:hypothetical protein